MSVIIDGQKYSLQSIPDEKFELVQKAKEVILGRVNFQDLCGNLERIGKLVHLAHIVVIGCGYGPSNDDMRMSIYELGTDITNLSSLSFSTILMFQASSSVVIQQLQNAVEYLLQGFEKQAVQCLVLLGETALEMAKKADKLKQKFEEKDVAVKEAMGILQKAENARGVNQKNVKMQQESLNCDIKLYREAREKIIQEENIIDEGIENDEEPSMFTAILQQINITQDIGEEEISENREVVVKFYELDKKQRELYKEQLEVQIASFSSLLSKYRNTEKDLGDAIKFLQEASHALQHAVNVMSDAAAFWKMLSNKCNKLSQINKRIIPTLHSQEGNLQIWHSIGFIRQTIFYKAEWVALYSICREYAETAKQIQSKLMRYNTANPSVEEARKTFEVLLQELKEETEQLKKANDRHCLAVQDKIERKKLKVE